MATPRQNATFFDKPDKPQDQPINEDKVISDFETQKIKVEVKCDSEAPKVNSFKNDISDKVKEASPRNEVAVPIRKSSLKKIPPPIKCDDSPPQAPLPSPPKCATPPKVQPEALESSPTVKEIAKNYSPPKVTSPPINKEVLSPPLKNKVVSPPWGKISPLKKEINSPSPVSYTGSPPSTILKQTKNDIHIEENIVPPKVKRDSVTAKDIPKTDKLSLPNNINENILNCEISLNKTEDTNGDKSAKNEESNGVGDKIKIFEKAAEEAGKLSRPGSVRGRARVDRLGSDSKEDLPPPATPFKDNICFDLVNNERNLENLTKNESSAPPKLERQQSMKISANSATKWQRSSNSLEEKIHKPEPQKIIKPEFKPITPPVDITIRSPSIVGKLPEQFPSQGTAFRNVALPDTSRAKPADDQFKTCKVKNKEKYSVSKGSSYFTRGSEEIWLVKKKDIEEIEERVLDSFRRAGGNFCNRSESMRPSSDGGQSFTHATMGRNKRQMYARSESLDPQWAGNRSQTLKRQTSVACTCGHDKKTRSKSAGSDATARQRSKSHGDDNQSQVLDKYETLV